MEMIQKRLDWFPVVGFSVLGIIFIFLTIVSRNLGLLEMTGFFFVMAYTTYLLMSSLPDHGGSKID